MSIGATLIAVRPWRFPLVSCVSILSMGKQSAVTVLRSYILFIGYCLRLCIYGRRSRKMSVNWLAIV